MERSTEARLDRLEMLYAEQDHTIQVLNRMVAQQEREISRLHRCVGHLETRLETLMADFSSDINPRREKPPHY